MKNYKKTKNQILMLIVMVMIALSACDKEKITPNIEISDPVLTGPTVIYKKGQATFNAVVTGASDLDLTFDFQVNGISRQKTSSATYKTTELADQDVVKVIVTSKSYPEYKGNSNEIKVQMVLSPLEKKINEWAMYTTASVTTDTTLVFKEAKVFPSHPLSMNVDTIFINIDGIVSVNEYAYTIEWWEDYISWCVARIYKGVFKLDNNGNLVRTIKVSYYSALTSFSNLPTLTYSKSGDRYETVPDEYCNPYEYLGNGITWGGPIRFENISSSFQKP